MGENVKNVEETKKLSYEELERIIVTLDERFKQLQAKYQEVLLANVFKRLEFLFKVIENKSQFPSEFHSKCVNEIIDIMTVPSKEE